MQLKFINLYLILLCTLTSAIAQTVKSTSTLKESNWINGEWKATRFEFETENIPDFHKRADPDLMAVFGESFLPKIRFTFEENGQYVKDTLSEEIKDTYENIAKGVYQILRKNDTLYLTRNLESNNFARIEFRSKDTLIIFGRKRPASGLPFIQLNEKEKVSGVIRGNLVFVKKKKNVLEVVSKSFKGSGPKAENIQIFLPGIWKTGQVFLRFKNKKHQFSNVVAYNDSFLLDIPKEWYLFRPDGSMYYDQKNRYSVTKKNELLISRSSIGEKKFWDFEKFNIRQVNEDELIISVEVPAKNFIRDKEKGANQKNDLARIYNKTLNKLNS